MAMTQNIKRVDHEIIGQHAIVTFNNPARHNAMSVAMWAQLSETMSLLAQNDKVRMVILRGAGDKAFVSGADISEFDDQRSTQQQVIDYNELCAQADRAVGAFPKPTVARIQGYCIGGGLGLALACDMRICSDDATFMMPAAKLGLGYSYHDSTRLLRTLGSAKASEMFYTAKRYSAADALEYGLVNKVVTQNEIESALAEWVEQICGNAPLTQAAFKACAVNWADQDCSISHQYATDLIEQCYSSNDYLEARKAFSEKRRPVFNGN